jgi:hypothetical protein
MHKFTENSKIEVALAPQTIATASTEVAGAGVDMRDYRIFTAVCMLAAAAAHGADVVCHIAESIDDSTWSNTYLATATLQTDATVNDIKTMEIKSADLSDGYRYVRVEMTPGDSTKDVVGAVNIRSKPRYAAV